MSNAIEEYFKPKYEPKVNNKKRIVKNTLIWVSITGAFSAISFTFPILGIGYQNSLNNTHTEYMSMVPETTFKNYIGNDYDKELIESTGENISDDVISQAEKKFNKAYNRYADGKLGFLSKPYFLESRKDKAVNDFKATLSDNESTGINALNNTLSMICKDKSYFESNDYDSTSETDILNIDLNRAASATQFTLEHYFAQLQGNELKEKKEKFNSFFYEKISKACPSAT